MALNKQILFKNAKIMSKVKGVTTTSTWHGHYLLYYCC